MHQQYRTCDELSVRVFYCFCFSAWGQALVELARTIPNESRHSSTDVWLEEEIACIRKMIIVIMA